MSISSSWLLLAGLRHAFNCIANDGSMPIYLIVEFSSPPMLNGENREVEEPTIMSSGKLGNTLACLSLRVGASCEFVYWLLKSLKSMRQPSTKMDGITPSMSDCFLAELRVRVGCSISRLLFLKGSLHERSLLNFSWLCCLGVLLDI